MAVQAFLSYAAKDKDGALEVEKNCAAFTQSGRLVFTQDLKEKQEVTVSVQTKQKIEQSQIFIALFTQDYVYTGACRDELYIAFQLHLAGRLEILPIAWKECHWTSISGTIQRLVLPKDKRIVTYADGWRDNPRMPWDQILNRLSLYLQKAEYLTQNRPPQKTSFPLIQTSQEILQKKSDLRPANEAVSHLPLKNSEAERLDFIRKSHQTISWIFQKRLAEYKAEHPNFEGNLEICAPDLSIVSLCKDSQSKAQASLVMTSRSDPVTIKMGNGLPPSLLGYYEGILEKDSFAVSMGEFLLTGKGQMAISPHPSCILEIVEGPSSFGWGRTKKHRSNIREKLMIKERPSQNGFSPEEVANIFWRFFMEQIEGT